MNFYFVITLLSSLFTLLLGIVVLLKNSKNNLNRVFFLFSFFISIWLTGSAALLRYCHSAESAILLDRITYFGVIFIPPSLLHLNTLFAKEAKQKILILTGYFISVIFFLLSLSDKFISGLIQYPWGCHTKAGIFHDIFVVYFIIFVIFAFRRLIIAHRNAIGSEKVQLKYVLIAFAVLSMGGLGFLPAYGINFPPFVYLCGFVAVIIMTYAIVRHRLMDIRIVLRKYSVYLAALFSIFGPIILVKYLIEDVLQIRIDLADYAYIIIAIAVFPSLQNRYFHLANKYFFSSLYDAREVIAELSDKLSSTLLANKIYRHISESVVSAFHVRTVNIYIYNEDSKEYEVNYNYGEKKNQVDSFIEDRGFYTHYFKKNKAIITEEIKKSTYVKFKKTIEMLKKQNIEIIIPLSVKKRVIGVLTLGAKETNESYNDEDIQLLEIIGAQSAIAIENALNYEEVRNFSKKLEKEVDKATEELIRANSKLRQLDEAKSEFVSIASHQLRTPLTVIKGYISMIIDGNFGKISKTQKAPLEQVYESNERLIQLVENLLNISRIESGRLHFKYEKIQLEELILSVVMELGSTAAKRGLKLVFKKPQEKLPGLTIDREKIRQVVMNLVDNAIKYGHKGEIKISIEKENDYLLFCVSDQGIGVKDEDLANLFNKFTRGSGSSLVETEGTGLGLYVAEQMIKAHKGRIWAESKGEGQGSRFCFTLPINK